MTLFYRLCQRDGAFYRRLRDKAISALAVFRRRFFDWIDERSVIWLHKAGTSDSMKRRTLRRLKRGRVRSLWGCTPILTLPMKSRADRSLGFVSYSLVFTTYSIFRSFDLNLSKLVGFSYRQDYTFGRTIHRFVLYIAMRRYDVFHFFFDRDILRPVCSASVLVLRRSTCYERLASGSTCMRTVPTSGFVRRRYRSAAGISAPTART